MTDSNTATYGGISRLNHWIVALGVLGMLAVGFYLEFGGLTREAKGPIMALHKATGTVLLLVILWRVVWRIRQGFPAPAPGMAGWQVLASKVTHWGLLVMMLVMPVSGVSMSLLGGRPISIYGLFTIPPVAKIEAVGEITHEVHEYGAWILAILVALHIAAAIKHLVIDKDGVLARMTTGKAIDAA
jgi:cytochrome b561